MKKNYNYKQNTFLGSVKKNLNTFYTVLFLVLITIPVEFYSQQSYTFTPASATGTSGPTQTQINSAYLSTNLNGSVIVTSGIQSFTIPISGSYRIASYGAQGGGSTGGANTGSVGGLGASMIGDFALTTGQVLKILVGQQGGSTPYGGGGGGGSFVVDNSNNPLVIAGGGGGGNGYVGYSRGVFSGGCGLTSTSGGNSNQTSGSYGAAAPGTGGGAVASGGTSGYGGGGAVTSGGGGFYNIGGAGSNAFPGQGYLQGGAGGAGNTTGNFGGFGGGGGGTNNSGYGGGGGGYSGGGGGNWNGTTHGNGGGGGSYNNGSNQNNTACINAGDGVVIITELCSVTLNSIGTSSLGAICSGSSVTLTTNGVSNYNWSTGNTTSSVIVVSPTVTTTYSISATSPSACTSSAYLTVTVYSGLPVLSVVNSATNASGICPAQSVTLTASGAVTYNWTNGVINGVSFSPTTSSGYTVTGGNACGTSTAATSVSINPIPAVTAVASTASLCSGNSLTLTGVGTATGYVWSGGSVGANGAGFFPSSTVTYTVIGTNAQTCTNSAMTTVTVVTTPALAPVLSPALICIGKSSTVTASGATNYTWLPGSFGNTTTVILSPTSTTSYTLTKANANCVDIKVFTITVNNLPNIFTLASPTVICASTSATLFGGGANTYTWTAPNFTTTGASPVVSPAVSTTYSVAASDGTCIGINTVFLATNPNPTVTIAATSTAICFGQSITLTANGAANYTWLPSGNNNTVITDSPPTTTVYPITGTNIFGCTNSTSQVVIVNPLPSVNASTNKNLVCVGFPATLTATGANTYLWLNNNAPTAVTVVNPLVTTVFTVVGTYTTTGCSNTKTVQVSVFDPTLTITGSPSVCIGGAITLIAGGAQTYTWNTSPVQNFPAITVSPSVATVYIVTATSLSTAVSCVSSKSISISIYLNPTITAVAQRTVICKFESGNLIANGGDTYVWSTGQTGSVIPVSPLTLNNTYTVTGTDVNGCIGNATVSLKVSGCTGLNEITIGNQQLEIYPNPNSGEFMLRSAADMNLTLTNELGQVIRTISLSELNDYKLLVSNLAPGIYFITGEKDALKISQKIIVTK